MESDEFRVDDGLRQGGVLGLILFNIVLDDVIKNTREETSRIFVGHGNLEMKQIAECAFADDLVVFGRNEDALKRNLQIWRKKLEKRNLRINKKKNKVHEQVKTFKCLEVQLESWGTQEAEINNRIANASRIYHAIKSTFLSKKEVSLKAKIAIYNTVFVHILTFGYESWTLTTRLKNKLQSISMKYLRRVLGMTRMDRIGNGEIRERLKVQSKEKKIEEAQLR
ncbi:uncharacterized protein [Diabrotica undecimpunctata]|uniref:uncharacterized protein n=1 Tax=Diabrotica undecimpunctata TaxID=50387 RepID=UPI003B63585A